MRESLDIPINFSDLAEKREFVSRVSGLQGYWRVKIEPARRKGTDQQRKYYFAAHVKLAVDYLLQRGWKIQNADGSERRGTKDDLHEMMKFKFLRSTIVHPETGEVLGERTRSTKECNTMEMSDFMEAVAGWIYENFSIDVPPAELYREERGVA